MGWPARRRPAARRLAGAPAAGHVPTMGRVKRPVAVGLVAAAVVVSGGVAWGLTAGSGGGPGGVRVGRVSRATVTEVVEAPATVSPKASAQVRAAADGRVADLRVRDGQHVHAGQLLLRVDSPSARKQLAQARRADAEVGAGEVALPASGLSGRQDAADAAARRAFARARTAARQIPDPKPRAGALAAVAQAEAQYEAASAQARQAVQRFEEGVASLSSTLSSVTRAQQVQTQAAVATAERVVSSLTVRAPIDGVVSLGTSGSGGGGGGLPSGLLQSLPSDLSGAAGGAGAAGGSGQLTDGSSGSGSGADAALLSDGVPVTAGDVLAGVTDVSSLGLSADVDETDVLLVHRGVTADVELDAVPGASYGGRVTSVALKPTTSSRGGVSYAVHLALTGGQGSAGGPAPTPRPGMSAVADLRVRRSVDAVSVPSSAVVRDLRQDSVWAVENGRVTRRTVRLGAQGTARVQVLSGLRVGDRVVVRGADRVSEGQSLS